MSEAVAVKSARETRRLRVNVEITDAAPRPAYKGQYLPQSALVEYTNDGSPPDVKVFGPKLKKDGTLGQVGYTERFWYRDPIPEWLVPLIQAECPEWAVAR